MDAAALGLALPDHLAPSKRYHVARNHRHKKLTDWARQAILQVRRWLPDRKIVIVAAPVSPALDLIAAVRRHVCLVTRLRLRREPLRASA